MRKGLVWLAAAVVSVAACGPGNDLGFYASGSLSATLRDPAAGSTTDTGFAFGQRTRIDPSLPQGSAGGITGICQVGPNGRNLRLTRIGGDAFGVREINITMPNWDLDSCTSCNHGHIDVTVGSTVFSGDETRGGTAPSACTFESTRNGSFGMDLRVQCNGLLPSASPQDTRRVDIQGTLALEECDGPETR